METFNQTFNQTFDGLLPTNIFVLENNKIVEKSFVIMDWIDDNIKNLFTEEVILQAVKNINISFKDLYTITFETNNIYTKTTYSIHRFEQTIKEKTYHKPEIITNKYTIFRKSGLNQKTLFLECLLLTFPKLAEFKQTVIVDDFAINIKEIQTSHICLSDIPTSMKNMTINEILALPKDYVVKEEKLPIKVYLDSSDKVKMYFEVDDRDSVGILLEDIKNRDLTNSEENTIRRKISYAELTRNRMTKEEIEVKKTMFKTNKYLKFKDIIQNS